MMTEHIDAPDTTPPVRRRTRPYSTSRPPSTSQRLISIQQAVSEYGLPLSTLRDLVFRGAVPRVLLPDGRRWWFDRRDLDRWIERAKATGVV